MFSVGERHTCCTPAGLTDRAWPFVDPASLVVENDRVLDSGRRPHAVFVGCDPSSNMPEPDFLSSPSDFVACCTPFSCSFAPSVLVSPLVKPLLKLQMFIFSPHNAPKAVGLSRLFESEKTALGTLVKERDYK